MAREPEPELELEPGEEILWRGRPVARANWGPSQYAGLIIGGPAAASGAWSAFAGWRAGREAAALGYDGGGVFAVLPGLVWLGFGLAALAAGLWYAPRRKAGTLYILTNRRAVLIERNPVFGRRVVARPILEGAVLELVESGDGTGKVWFHREEYSRPRDESGTVRERNIGFLDIAEAGKVYMIIQGLRDAAAAGAATAESGETDGKAPGTPRDRAP